MEYKHNKRIFNKLLTVLVIFTVVFVVSVSAASAEDIEYEELPLYKMFGTDKYIEIENIEKQTYREIYEKWTQEGIEDTKEIEIILSPSDQSIVSSGDVEYDNNIGGKKESVLIWEDKQEWYEWTVNVTKSGLYYINIDYYPILDSAMPISRGIMINGEFQYEEAESVFLPRMFNDDGSFRTNTSGNEVPPRQVEIREWYNRDIDDLYGYYEEPLRFYFKEGENKIRLTYNDQAVAIGNITIKSPDDINPYNAYEIYGMADSDSQVETVKIQAEKNILYKSTVTLLPFHFSADMSCEPFSVNSKLLNAIYTSEKNQTITWQFEVKDSGIYKIGLRYYSENDEIYTARQIKIDGKIPYEELIAYKFPSCGRSSALSIHELQNDQGETILFYLEKGVHTISMQVKLGLEMSEIINTLQNDAQKLSDIYLKIYMLTGDNPDYYYNYSFEKNIPGMYDEIDNIILDLEDIIIKMNDMAGKNNSAIAQLQGTRDRLIKAVKYPEDIARELDSLNTAQNSMASVAEGFNYPWIDLDYIVFAGVDEKIETKKVNIFTKLKFLINGFIKSFKESSTEIGGFINSEDMIKETISVWIARGKEWCETIQQLADEQFTPETGIGIKINIVTSSSLETGDTNLLLLALAAGRAPDMGSALVTATPGEFALRNAITDFDQFSDFSEIKDNFLEETFNPVTFNGKVYAIPETMNISMIFYRTDIFDDLGLEVPQTWEDLKIKLLPELYRNNMKFSMTPSYYPFLFQYGGNFYNSDFTKSALDTAQAYNAFVQFTSLYTTYGLPAVTESFYSAFRKGTTPIGIGNFPTYLKIKNAAQELAGKWAMAPIPGTLMEDGTINRSTNGCADTYAVIFSDSDKKESCWKYIKWWTGFDTQNDLGNILKSYIGEAAKWRSSNINAFYQTGWTKEELNTLYAQAEWYREVPYVAGGYILARSIHNAWSRVVSSNYSPRDSLEITVKDINKELERKQNEYDLLNK